MVLPADMGDEPRELEHCFWVIGGGEPEFWREHFADDGLVLLPHGILDKAQTVAAMEQARPWASVEMENLQRRTLSDDHVLLAYTARAVREGEVAEYRAAISSLYVRRDDQWQLFCHQQSPTDMGSG